MSSARGVILEKEKVKLNNSIFMNKNSNTNNSEANNDKKNLEKIHSLLVFDPLSDGLAIKNSLQNKTSSWKSNVKRGEDCNEMRFFLFLHKKCFSLLFRSKVFTD